MAARDAARAARRRRGAGRALRRSSPTSRRSLPSSAASTGARTRTSCGRRCSPTSRERRAVGELVYERDGRVVAQFELAPVELGSAHRGLAQPDRAALLGWAASLPEARGTGAGLALMDASLALAHEQSYASMVTDWRETNLLSSRFWPARGFRRSFLRL